MNFFLKTPQFWYKQPNIGQKLILKPLSWLYGYIAHYRYNSEYQHELNNNQKVIAIGGITSGGSGKTLVVSSLCHTLTKMGFKPAILSRGYGRTQSNSIKKVSPQDSYKNVGDEPLLLSQQWDVFVGKNRFKTAELASEFDFLILDDGITQRSLKPNKKIIVISASQCFGNGELLPLGPNRLNLENIKHDIDAIFLIHENNKSTEHTFTFPSNIPVYHGYIKHNFGELTGRLMLFCGLGYPKKFFQSFSNFQVCKTVSFPDHYPYKDIDIQNLIQESTRLNAQLVTTEKDLMRIPEKYRVKIKTISIEISWNNPIEDLFSIE